MKLGYLNIALLSFGIVAMIACGKNKSDNKAAVNGGVLGDRILGPANLPTGQSALAGQTGAFVVGTSMTQMQFDERIKILLSGSLTNLVNVGSVDSQRGVQIIGRVPVNSTNGNASTDAQLRLLIADSKTVAGTEEPFRIDMSGATGGASNGRVNLVFSDSVGSITLIGTYNAATLQATVSFANTQGTGYNGQKSGTLGTFSIQTCAFLVCQ